MKTCCEICGGARVIRLPVRRRPALADFAGAAAAPRAGCRVYPCPECAETIPLERLAVVEAVALVASDMRGEGEDWAKRDAAQRLFALALEDGYVRFERGPLDERESCFPLRATIGLVSPRRVADLEERIALRQEEVAREVAAEAARGILAWGSLLYGVSGHVRKAQALDSVRDALARVLARHAARKAM